MNEKTKQALKMAIEALETCKTYNAYEQSFETILVEKAIQECKEFIAQPAQEPDLIWQDGKFKRRKDLTLYGGEKFYTHPAPSWQGLSDDDREEIKNRIYEADDLGAHRCPLDFAMIEAEKMLKDKNT